MLLQNACSTFLADLATFLRFITPEVRRCRCRCKSVWECCRGGGCSSLPVQGVAGLWSFSPSVIPCTANCCEGFWKVPDVDPYFTQYICMYRIYSSSSSSRKALESLLKAAIAHSAEAISSASASALGRKSVLAGNAHVKESFPLRRRRCALGAAAHAYTHTYESVS